MIPYIMITGYSNSGKTLVIRKIIAQLTARGYRAAVIKHAHEGYDVDVPGKDSWHFFHAGAEEVIVAGQQTYTRHRRADKALTLSGLLSLIEDVDIIIVEGFKNSPGPKVHVYREGHSSDKLPFTGEVIALVEDGCQETQAPCFSFGEMEKLTDYILEQLGLNDSAAGEA